MAGEFMVGASGMAAEAVRPLIAAALTNVTAEPVRKFRRDNIVLILLMAGRFVGIGGEDRAGILAQASAAEHDRAEIG